MEKDKESNTTRALAQTLYDTALLESGFDLDNPQDFNQRIHRIMAANMGLQGSLDTSRVRCTALHDVFVVVRCHL